jgi:hypothetical protein
MGRATRIGIVVLWLLFVVLLFGREWGAPRSASAPDMVVNVTEADEWMGVYYQSQKIGYASQRVVADPEGVRFAETAVLRLQVLETPQTVRTVVHGSAGADFALREVDFELSSGSATLRVRGIVEGNQLRLETASGAETNEQVLPLTEPIRTTSALRASLRGRQLQVGEHFEAMVFDPMVLSNDRMHVYVEAEEPIPGERVGVRGWRLREEFRGMRTKVWVDAAGIVLREEGPMGLTLVRESPDDAVRKGWVGDTLLDIVAQAAVPVDHPIADARERESVRLRLTGIASDLVPSDEYQRWDGSVLTITRADLGATTTYTLPYTGAPEIEEYLRPTAVLQSNHPRLRAQAQEILAGTTDARTAVQRLNDWVHWRLRKVPTVTLPNALQVLELGEGDCNEHAVLLAGLARAAGVPARVVVGAVYLDGVFLYHAWDEVWLGRWVPVDAALHQFPVDATHIKFVSGEPEAQLAMLEIIGRLRIQVLPETPAHG